MFWFVHWKFSSINYLLFFCFRQQCYKCVLDSLQRLLVIKTSPLQSPGLPTQPGPPPAPDPNTMTPLEADKLVCFKFTFFPSDLSSKAFSINCLPCHSCNVSLNNLFNVTGDKYGFLSVPIGLSFVKYEQSEILTLIFITRTIKNKFKTI